MGKGSTQFQHLIQTEPPISILEGWLAKWAEHNNVKRDLSARLRPQSQGSDILQLDILDSSNAKLAEVVFTEMCDREDKVFLFIRNQIIYDTDLRRRRLMTLLQLFLIHRYKADIIQYMTPTEDNRQQTNGMKRHELFEDVIEEIGDIIVAHVHKKNVAEILRHDGQGINQIIIKG
jgi:isocitrate lyase